MLLSVPSGISFDGWTTVTTPDFGRVDELVMGTLHALKLPAITLERSNDFR